MAKQHDKQFKEDGVQYYLEHKDLGVKGCAKNLGIGISTLRKWVKESQSENGFQVRGSCTPLYTKVNYSQQTKAHLKVVQYQVFMRI